MFLRSDFPSRSYDGEVIRISLKMFSVSWSWPLYVISVVKAPNSWKPKFSLLMITALLPYLIVVHTLEFFSVCAGCLCYQCMNSWACLRLRFSVFVWTIVCALTFLSVCMKSCACAYVSQFLNGLLCAANSVVWILVRTFAFPRVCINSRTLSLHFSVFVWTLVRALAFVTVCMN